ncbi:hypothetical protein [Dyella tabacisoli]|nr:hypothetical protein [Dyella tabacisoli]
MAISTSNYQRGAIPYPDCNATPMCDSTPVCPACGGLECLCRPRFFAGQLLTDEDLNRLDHYIVAKNRLHNRYLVGTGVACGLEVICNVCGPDQGGTKVTVRPGYAVSPCGNDIVLCKNVSVDVCDLIGKCRPQTDADCFQLFPAAVETTKVKIPAAELGKIIKDINYKTGNKTTSYGDTEDWVLAVCYAEKPSRGVGALRESANGPGGCSCGGQSGCSCGGSGSSGGCSCGGSSSTGKSDCGCSSTSTASKPAKNAPVSCEPTLTCEGYSFKVYKAPNTSLNRWQTNYGEAAKRFMCCILPLMESVQGSLKNKAYNHGQIYGYLLSLRDTMAEFIRSQGFYDCELASRLAAVGITAPDSSVYDLKKKSTGLLLMQSYARSLQGLSSIAEAVMQKCLCGALLPPCSPSAMADCVPLATITVSASDCRVMQICNISARAFLPTWPNIQYWLSMFSGNGGLFGNLRQTLEDMCCGGITWGSSIGVRTGANGYSMHVQSAQVQADVAKGKAKAPPAPAADTTVPGVFASLLGNAIAQPDRQVNAQSLFLGSLGMTQADGTPLVSEQEQAHPADFLLAHQVMAPLLRQILPASALDMFSASPTASAAAAPAGATGKTVDVNELAEQVNALRKQLAEHKRLIATMTKRKP